MNCTQIPREDKNSGGKSYLRFSSSVSFRYSSSELSADEMDFLCSADFKLNSKQKEKKRVESTGKCLGFREFSFNSGKICNLPFGQHVGIQLIDAMLFWVCVVVRGFRFINFHVSVILVGRMIRLQHIQFIEFGALATSIRIEKMASVFVGCENARQSKRCRQINRNLLRYGVLVKAA